jgi:hypothetical protein
MLYCCYSIKNSFSPANTSYALGFEDPANSKQSTATIKGAHQNSFSSLRCEDLPPIIYMAIEAIKARTPMVPKTVFLFMLLWFARKK